MQFVSCTSDGTETNDLALVKTQLKRLEHQVTSLEQTVQGLTVDNIKLMSQLEISDSKLKQSIAKNNVQMDVLKNDLHKLQHDLNAGTTGEMIKDISNYFKSSHQLRVTI